MKFQVFSIAILALALTVPSVSSAAKKKAQGVFTVVKGKVTIQRAGKKKARKVKVGTKVYAKDTITAKKDSRAKVIMVDKNILNISPKSKMQISEYEFDPKTNKKKVMLNLMYGKVRSTVKQKYDGEKNVYRVKTPSAVAGVRGTDFFVNFNARSRQSQVVTFEGQVQVGSGISAAGQIMNAVPVNPGQFTVSTPSAPPKPAVAVPKAQLANLDRSTNADVAASGPKNDGPSTREPAQENKKDNKRDNQPKERPDKPDSASNDAGPNKDGAKKGPRGPKDGDLANRPKQGPDGDQNNKGPKDSPRDQARNDGPRDNPRNQAGPNGPKDGSGNQAGFNPKDGGPTSKGPQNGPVGAPNPDGDFRSGNNAEYNGPNGDPSQPPKAGEFENAGPNGTRPSGADNYAGPNSAAPGFGPDAGSGQFRDPASVGPKPTGPPPAPNMDFMPPAGGDFAGGGGFDPNNFGPDPIGEFDQYQPIDPSYTDPSFVDGHIPDGAIDAIQNTTRLIIVIGN